MVENIRKVGNPLTIIAIFAALAEVAGTIVLGVVPPAIQSIFVWFVMGFPVLLILLFFGTLFAKADVLYAPSDFADEKNYMELKNPAGNFQDQVSRLTEQLLELKANTAHSSSLPKDNQTVEPKGTEITNFGDAEVRLSLKPKPESETKAVMRDVQVDEQFRRIEATLKDMEKAAEAVEWVPSRSVDHELRSLLEARLLNAISLLGEADTDLLSKLVQIGQKTAYMYLHRLEGRGLIERLPAGTWALARER